MLVDMVSRSDGEHHETVAESVSVTSLTILQDAQRVGDAAVVCRHDALEIIVSFGKI